MILYIKHVDIEGPETIAPFFESKGFSSKIIELYNGQPFPTEFDDIEAVICLGGPMNVNEEDRYSFLKDENIFIQRVLQNQVPFLGICLGSQLLSKAAGGKVTRSPKEEIGWGTVRLTPEGQRDPLFRDLPQELNVYQWHGDMFSVPSGGVLLAAGSDCPHQALKIGKSAYGIQFHIEITDKSINEWSDEYFALQPVLRDERKSAMLIDYQKNVKVFKKEAHAIYNNFLNIINQ